MNAVCFCHFWHYLLDLHNHKVLICHTIDQPNFLLFQMEGNLRHVANPLVKSRLEKILQDKEVLEVVVKYLNQGVDDVEVSMYFYGDCEPCKCTRNAYCQSSRCTCFQSKIKCGIYCQNSVGTSKCKN